ncbi:MAG: aldehyde dehydrogenase family protein [Planctomycetes bacterium]|nr:aldehyde dehydrogenase family protein [Planctomycetota bacterium]
MVEAFRNFIGVRWVAGESGRLFDDTNPADASDVIGRFPLSGTGDVDAAVAAARAALPRWRAMPAPARGEILFRAGALLAERKEIVARLMTREMGKVVREARGDVQEAIDQAYLSGGEGRRLHGQTAPCELPNKLGYTVRVPVGVCALITPWNFPVAIPAWKAFPALICGNTVVLKPAEDAPACASKFVEVLAEAGVPEGVVNLAHGRGEEAGAALVSHAGVDLVSFTGSREVGAAVAAECGRTLKNVSLELGGKNAAIVMPDADLELAADGVLWGAFGTTGQRCTATSRLLAHERIAAAFVKRLVKRAEALVVGNGLDARVEVGPLVNREQLSRVERMVKAAVRQGARVATGGRALAAGEHRRGHFYAPTLLTSVTPRMRLFREEVFGPVLAVTTFRDYDEAVALHNDCEYGLSSAIYTRDVNVAHRAARDLEAGITYVNGPTIGAEVQFPFGGVKNTGNGHREAGQSALDIFSEWKTVYVDFSGRLQRAQIDTARVVGGGAAKQP